MSEEIAKSAAAALAGAVAIKTLWGVLGVSIASIAGCRAVEAMNKQEVPLGYDKMDSESRWLVTGLIVTGIMSASALTYVYIKTKKR